MCNDTMNGSCALSVEELRDQGSPNLESQYSSQDLLVICRDVLITKSPCFTK